MYAIRSYYDLATRGVVVTAKQAARLNHYRPLFEKANQRTILLDQEWQEGDTIRYPELAETLSRIRDLGRDEFYKGKTADLLVASIQQGGGIMTKEDLAAYEAKWRDPIMFSYKDSKIISMPPPSSGGICLAQILKSIEPFNIGQYEQNSVPYIQLLTEAELV